MTIEEMRLQLQKRFNDLDISKANFKEELFIHSFDKDCFDWRIIICKHELKLRPYHDIHNDLIILANDFRKEYFNVL